MQHADSVVTTLQDESRKVESLLSKRATLQQKRGDLERKIRELGSLPADAFEKYRDHSLKQLLQLLQKAQTQLKKYGCALCSSAPACQVTMCVAHVVRTTFHPNACMQCPPLECSRSRWRWKAPILWCSINSGSQ